LPSQFYRDYLFLLTNPNIVMFPHRHSVIPLLPFVIPLLPFVIPHLMRDPAFPLLLYSDFLTFPINPNILMFSHSIGHFPITPSTSPINRIVSESATTIFW
jgi:hypothetical protein